MNELGAKGEPFAFIIDFDFEKPLIFDYNDSSEVLWKTPVACNYIPEKYSTEDIQWDIHPIKFHQYKGAFTKVQHHIHNGDTYLLNLTMPTKVETNLGLEKIFQLSNAPYKIWLKNQFVCFSP